MDMNSEPALASGCRLHPTQDVLLVPEGTLNLSGPARDILMRLNGSRSVAAIADDLLKTYPDADEAEVRKDVLDLLNRLQQRGVVRG